MTMAALPVSCKGTVLEQFVSSAYVVVAGVISLDLPTPEGETYEADYLANAGYGIPYAATGRIEGGKASGECWLDPTGSGGNQSSALALLTTPNMNSPAANTAASSTSQQAWQIVFKGNPFASPWPAWMFYGANFSMGGTAALKEGLKGKFSIKLSAPTTGGPVTFTTATV